MRKIKENNTQHDNCEWCVYVALPEKWVQIGAWKSSAKIHYISSVISTQKKNWTNLFHVASSFSCFRLHSSVINCAIRQATLVSLVNALWINTIDVFTGKNLSSQPESLFPLTIFSHKFIHITLTHPKLYILLVRSVIVVVYMMMMMMIHWNFKCISFFLLFK